MKKQIFLFLSLCTTTFLAAQITITANDLPQVGYTYFTSTDTTPSISLGNPSPNFQSWDFSNLSMDFPSVPTYGATSWTPYAAAFPASNLYTYGPAALYSSFFGGAPVGTQGMNKGYMFWRTDNTGFWIVGFRADSGSYANQNVLENPKELLIGTPCTYGTSLNNLGKWQLAMNQNSLDVDTFYVNRVEKGLTGDAWGSLIIPTGSYPDVLRIHEYIIKCDSVYARFGSTLVYSAELSRDTLNNYIYLANNIHYPLSIVHCDRNQTVLNVEYYSGVFASQTELSSLSQFSAVFPNPVNTTGFIKIPDTYNLDEAQIGYYDMTGKLLSRTPVTSNNHELNAIDFPSGVYFYLLTNSAGETMKGKFSIVK